MADKNLHDIKIDDLDNQKKTPLKNILTLLALLFIILVISVVITKLILNTDEEEIIENNPTTNTISTESETNSELNSTNALTATGLAIAGTAGVIASTTNNDATGVKDTLSNATSTSNTSKTPKEKNVSNSKTKVTLRDHQPVKTIKELGNANNSKKSTKKTYIDKKAVAKKVATKKAKASVASYNLTTGYYIKVGTFKDISTAVAKVKKTALNYKLIKTKNDKTMTRVLIGPFSSQDAAKSHLKNVQMNITSGAYITRIK